MKTSNYKRLLCARNALMLLVEIQLHFRLFQPIFQDFFKIVFCIPPHLHVLHTDNGGLTFPTRKVQESEKNATSQCITTCQRETGYSRWKVFWWDADWTVASLVGPGRSLLEGLSGGRENCRPWESHKHSQQSLLSFFFFFLFSFCFSSAASPWGGHPAWSSSQGPGPQLWNNVDQSGAADGRRMVNSATITQ